jgi:4-amino-4-deoxy-L-arabinose transferase-like glycosyltransferase
MTDWLKKNRDKIFLLLILLLTAFLAGYKIWEMGDGNAYYTATVKSMLTSWRNFFYASFDPGGFISVDKPALGFWLQCLFGLIFGVHGWSLALPEVICSVISVAVLYHIVKRGFGATAGLLSALFLALTPVFIAATRSNNVDASLVMVCLFAVWAVMIAAEKGSLKHLLLAAALIGIGFNIKMLQAYLYLPALFLVYFFAANTRMKKRLAHLAIAAVVLLAVSLSWCVIVDLTPADARPYVGSSEMNSALELAVGYNGIARVLTTQSGFSGGAAWEMTASSFIPCDGGEAGVLRLYNSQMAGQAGWLLVLAVFGILALLMKVLSKKESDKKPFLRELLLWFGLFAPMCAFFSISGHFHRYYLIMFAPCLAALSAIAVTEFYRRYKRDGETGKNKWQNILLPLSITVTAAVQVYILKVHYSAYAAVLVPVIVIGVGLSVVGLIAVKILKKKGNSLVVIAVAVGVLGLLAAPAYWAYSPIAYGSSAVLPVAGPSGTTGGIGFDGGGNWNMGGAGNTGGAQGAFNPSVGKPPESGAQGGEKPFGSVPSGASGNSTGFGSSGGFGEIPSGAVEYMMAHYNGARWLVAVTNVGPAEPIILDYGVGVMAMGGFIGMDKAISLEGFKELVSKGELQYFWAGGFYFSEISRWVTDNGVKIDAAEWGGSAAAGGILYDLSGLKTDK